MELGTLFKKCSEIATDVYWKQFYANASIGKFPMGFMIKDGWLYYRHKKRPDKIRLPQYDTELLMDVCQAFLGKTVGLMSEEDKQRNLKKHQEVLNHIPTKWTKIKTRALKIVLKELFILEQVNKFDLTPSEVAKLKSVIHIGSILNSFQNIKLNNIGLVEEFVGLEFNPETRTFTVCKKRPKIKKQKIILDKLTIDYGFNEDYYVKLWIKYFKSINKTIQPPEDHSILEMLNHGKEQETDDV